MSAFVRSAAMGKQMWWSNRCHSTCVTSWHQCTWANMSNSAGSAKSNPSRDASILLYGEVRRILPWNYSVNNSGCESLHNSSTNPATTSYSVLMIWLEFLQHGYMYKIRQGHSLLIQLSTKFSATHSDRLAGSQERSRDSYISRIVHGLSPKSQKPYDRYNIRQVAWIDGDNAGIFDGRSPHNRTVVLQS